MKKVTTTIFILAAFTFSLFAQEEIDERRERKGEYKTLFGDDARNGGYGGFSVQYGPLDENKDAIFFSGRGAAIFGHGLAVGVVGKGYLTDFYVDDVFGGEVNLAGGYGGLFVEPIIFPKFPVHVSFPLTFGVGGIALSSKFDTGNNEDWESYVEDTELYFLIEPGAELEFNLTRFFRLAFGVYYRYTTDIVLSNSEVGLDALTGFSGGITFKFGRF